MPHILLIHGAWHGAWCWYKMMPALEAAGFTPHAIDLPGNGLRVGEPSTLASYSEVVAEKLNALPEPAILLGHSMGGQTIRAAAELVPDRISTLVYLCAFLVKDGQSLLDLAGNDPGSEIAGSLVFRDDGKTDIPADKLKSTFYGDCPDEDVALAKLCLVPQAFGPAQAPLRITPSNFGRVRRTYIVCEQDRAIGVARQREMIEASGVAKQVTLNTSHSPFFSAPQKLVEAIKALV